MTEMQVHEERVMNLVESSSGNPTITPLTKTNAHRAESIRRIGTDKDAVAFHFRKKSTGMYMYIHTYTENGEEKELRASDFKNWEVTGFKYPGYLLMGKLLEVINKYQINVVSMASSNVSISMMLTASSDTLRIVQRELHKYAEMVIDENMSVIHIIGSLHWKRTQVESHIMDTIKDIPVSLISYGGSDHCFTLSVHTTDKNKLINSLSRQFFGNQCAA